MGASVAFVPACAKASRGKNQSYAIFYPRYIGTLQSLTLKHSMYRTYLFSKLLAPAKR